MLQRFGEIVHLTAHAPVHALYLGPCLQADYAVREEVEGLIAYLLGVMPVLEHGARIEILPYLVQFLDQLMVLVRRFEIVRHLWQRRRLQHIDDQHRMVCGERTAALGNQVGVSHAVLVGRIDKGVHAVVDVLLDGVVHRTFAARRARTVIVDTETTSAVHEVHIVAHLVQLDVELCSLAQGRLYASYLGDLTADVEMNEPQAVVQTFLVEYLQGREQFAGGQTELAGVTSAVLPLARPARSQFDSYAQVWHDIEFLGGLGDDLQFVEFLHDDEYALAHLLCEQRQFDVALVLVSVADDERVALTLECYDGMQLGFGTRLQSEIELAAVRDDLFHHRLHLVHLDRINDEVFRLVVILFGGDIEAVRRFFYSVVQNVRKSQQYGRCHIAQSELVHHVAQVYLRVVLTWCDVDIAFFVDAEIRSSPSVDIVELLSVFNCPFLHLRYVLL